MPKDPKRNFLAMAARIAELVVLIPLALWGLIQAVEAISSRKAISSFVSDEIVRLHESFSSFTIGIIGVSLAVVAALVLGYEARGKRVRHRLARPAAVVMIAGIGLALTATLYATKTGKVVNISKTPAGVGQTPTKTPQSTKSSHENSLGTPQTIAQNHHPLSSGAEATTSTAPSKYCDCTSSASRETWPEEEWGEPEYEEEEWGEPEEEPEEEWGEPEYEEEEWGEPEEEWEEEW